MSNLQMEELARLIMGYCSQADEPTLQGFAEWIMTIDTVKNPHRYDHVAS